MLRIPELPLPDITVVLQRYVEFVEPIDGIENKESSIEFINQVLSCFKNENSSKSSEYYEVASYFRLLNSLAKQYKRFCNISLHTSHMAPLWNALYLGNRDPLPIGWNYTLHFESPLINNPSHFLDISPQALRAAIIAAASFQVRYLVGQDEFFKPEVQMRLPKSCRVDLNLCRDQFSRLFRTVRIPHKGMDGLRWSNTNKVLLIHRGYPFIMNWVQFEKKENDINILSPLWLEEIITNARIIDTLIKETSNLPIKKDSPLVLSNGCRNKWAYFFERLWKDSISKVALDEITSCSFGISLNEEIDFSVSLHGGNYPENRYPDMNVMYSINSMGETSCNIEHSWGDGSTMIIVSSVIHYYTTSFINKKISKKYLTEIKSNNLSINIKQVNFGNINEELLNAISNTYNFHIQRVKKIGVTVRHIRTFGTNEIKKNCQVSPDAFMHAAFHLTQERIFGDQRSTYCALLMKKYYHGRTETLRTVTNSTKHLGNIIKTIKYKNKFNPLIASLLQKVSKEHRNRIIVCRAGEGFHRTAFLLRRIHNELRERLSYGNLSNFKFDIVKSSKIVEDLFFTSSAFRELSSDYLSTSNVTANGILSFCFGATHPDGIGIGYSLFNNRLTFTSSAFEGCKRPLKNNNNDNNIYKAEKIHIEYADTLENVINELYHLSSLKPPSKL